MKIIFWNIRGMGQLARVRQLKELMSQEKVDIIGIHETIKQSFSSQELERLSLGGPFSWNWVPSRGHSGGILMGVKEDLLQVENWEQGEFFVGTTVRHRILNFRWDVLVVYGPANHELSMSFLEELRMRCQETELPLMIGGILISSDVYKTKAQGLVMKS